MREASKVVSPRLVIQEKDQRQPPPRELLELLGPPYADEWKVHKGPFGISVLRYPFIEGSSDQPSGSGWLQILRQIQLMHENNFVHGDLLPRNVIFTSEGMGYVIDSEWSGPVVPNLS